MLTHFLLACFLLPLHNCRKLWRSSCLARSPWKQIESPGKSHQQAGDMGDKEDTASSLLRGWPWAVNRKLTWAVGVAVVHMAPLRPSLGCYSA